MRRLLEIWPTVTNLKCIGNKYTNYEGIKKTSISRIFKTMNHNGSYWLLFGKKKLHNFDVFDNFDNLVRNFDNFLFSGRLYCVETSRLIWGAFRLTGFFAVRMSTDGIFWANYTISFLVSFAFCLLDFLRLLLMVFKYSAYLVFLIKCFFRTQNCALPMSKGLVNTPVLNIPLFLRKSFVFKDVG